MKGLKVDNERPGPLVPGGSPTNELRLEAGAEAPGSGRCYALCVAGRRQECDHADTTAAGPERGRARTPQLCAICYTIANEVMAGA